MRLIGTAGHIDHGKSTLVDALTGIHPSRLPEERARGMTIDLGYAHLAHPDGHVLGVVDVPGHERLVRNMVAGATGFELALWVVDAREGPRPQSREHLQILDLLGVRALVPVVTKADLATPDEIHASLGAAASLLAGVGVPVRAAHVVDSVTGRGVDALRAAIFAECAGLGEHVPPADGAGALPYLPVDRAFSVKGAGTVVTGTLVRGRLAEGDEVAVGSLPGTWRVRALHNHGRRVAAIGAGHRVGVNLAGLDADAVRRGDVLVAPARPHAAARVNVRLHWVPGAPTAWAHGARLLFYAGAAEVECRLWDAAEHDGAWWGQIELPAASPFFPGQRFLLRGTAPLATVGGGEVLDLAPDRLRRVTPAERAAYASRAAGRPSLAAYLRDAWRDGTRADPARRLDALAARWMVDETALHMEAQADAAVRLGAVAGADGGGPSHLVWPDAIDAEVLARAQRFVDAQPRREQAVPYDRLAAALGVRAAHVAPLLRSALTRERPGAAALRRDVRLDRAGVVLFPGAVALSPEEQRVADEILARLRADGLRPAHVDEYRGADPRRRALADRALARLREARQVVRVSPELWLHADAAAELRAAPARLGLDGVRAAEFGRALGLSRKYSVPYVDYLGREGVLRREGDVHYRTGRGA